MADTKSKKEIIMSSRHGLGMRVLVAQASALMFAALFLILFSSAGSGVASLLGVIPGIVFAAVFSMFYDKKLVRYCVLGAAALYIALCIVINFSAFLRDVFGFWNDIAYTANAHAHWGLPYAQGEATTGGGFLFSSALGTAMALGVSVLALKSRISLIIISMAFGVVLIFVGLYPAAYAMLLAVISLAVMLVVDREFNFRSAVSYLTCAVLLCIAAAPCFLYGGNPAVGRLAQSIGDFVEDTVYGSDSLPEGRLKDAGGLRTGNDVRLEVELSSMTPQLYLKGFVGSDFDGESWSETDKNAYVEDGFQGLINYISRGGIPTVQFAGYAALNGNTNRYGVTVKNIGADARYVYLPYTAIDYTAGSSYYDMNLRASVFSPKTYTFEVFAGDRSYERSSQAQWLTSDALRNDRMREYMTLEGEYRAFVKHKYTVLDEQTKNLILNSVINVNSPSVNTATQLIRRYFIDGYEYSDDPTAIGGDFTSEFFGGLVKTGNAAYFATAATLIFRAYGLPARYVEGYLVRSGENAGEKQVLTGRNAHAWTEVYFDGMGWLPIEVTPKFFSEEESETPLDPTDPDAQPDNPDKPDLPDDQEDPEPEKPEEPTKPLTEEERALLGVLKVLIPILSVMLAFAAIILTVLVRRYVIIAAKQKKLGAASDSYGRAAYGIASDECKHFGGFDKDMLARMGINADRTDRFLRLIERNVYGGYDMSESERRYITDYIRSVSSALCAGSGWHRFVCRYIYCLGI